MPLSKTKDLLEQLSELETSLNEFSYDTLTTKEAASLKKHFSGFRSTLERKIYQPHASIVEEGDINPISEDKKVELFMAQISHEIRTPLNGIVGFTNLMKEEGLNTSQMEKVLAIENASNYLMDIINEVLDYAKLSSGNDTFKSVSFNLPSLIKDVMFLCRTLVVDKRVGLNYDIDPNIPEAVLGDPSELSQVLLNLLGNAIKFVEKGHVSLTVSQKNPNVLQFCVADTGIGIAEEELKQIFDRFQQASPELTHNFRGTGLGLSIVKKIIERQGGRISVASTLGKGTEFFFEIPYKKGDVTQIRGKRADSIAAVDGRKWLNGTEILVFEDNVLNQRLIGEQLKKWGCLAHITQDAAVGLDLLAKRPIALVLMDLKMPGMTGFEISEKIRSLTNKQGGSVPIVALSADFTSQDKEKCLTSGINDFLLKPYTLEALLTKVLKHKKEAPLSEESKALLKQPVIQEEQESAICLDHLLEDCFGKIDMLEELVRLLKQNIYEFIGTVKINMEVADYHNIALAAHKLKAGLTMVHAKGLKETVVALEEQAKMSQGERVGELYQEFLKSLPTVEDALNRALNRIKNK
jgi:signal transduction histidine kinase/DNA-binding NarL/FixJ family response regulator